MKDFTFYNPTKILFGQGTVPQIGDEVKKIGSKVLFVYGRESIKKSGLYDKVGKSLKKAGLNVVEHPGVKSNPTLSHTQAGIDLARKEGIECILAVGGGSVIDESKAIAAGIPVEHSVWDFYTGEKTIQQALPVLTVLTIPATGSEMNGGSVITNDSTDQKYGFMDEHLHPRVSILDPTLTYTVPHDYTAYSAVDAISHLIEGYFTHEDEWAPIQDGYVEMLVRTIMEATDRALHNPSDYQARATFMWAATLAWNGLGTAGVGDCGVPMHMLEHPLSGIYDIPHGAGLSITIPAWLKYMYENKKHRLARFAQNVFHIHSKPEAAAREGIDALQKWFEKIGSPTSFEDAKIPAGDIPKIADNARKLAEVWGLDDYSRDMIVDMYKLSA
jgi:hypothetical protein